MKKERKTKKIGFELCPYCWRMMSECKTWSWEDEDPFPQCEPQTDQEKYEDFINNQRKYG